jgi:hypothetical protein
MNFDKQLDFLSQLHAVDSLTWTTFADLHPIQQSQVVRETAKAEVQRLSEAQTSGS